MGAPFTLPRRFPKLAAVWRAAESMKFSPWLIVAGVGFAVTFGAGLRNIMVQMAMVEQVNRKAAPDQQIPVFSRGHWRRLVALYRAFYPDGDLVRQHWSSMPLMVAGMIGLVASLGRLG